ncbi:hypothetical protein SDRG_04704 [Saprolegnia diclina VS20]|uniref:Uncharacterized protein n=1 Tax=Saprolegnia diclina (strain VS20) TaxID=1156394 RepID=T0QI53_SAPDV|nr:hypothetical protein SDRG_04704 [Saprolegnia diclina VS20]EQC37674.1 hypothetical protein SDRG_04704 [Saprolegnia diclina VS20]|eukprot:XP_008608607.1 hypothetical protein SDRG_04704 [Saprolegnia diclina VS20]
MQASRRDTSRASTPEMYVECGGSDERATRRRSNAAVALADLDAQAYDAVALTMLDIVASLSASSQLRSIVPLIAELTDKAASTTGGVQEANLDVLVAILTRVGAKVSALTVHAVEDTLRGLVVTDDDLLRVRAGNGLAHAVSLSSEEHGVAMVEKLVQPSTEL